MNFINKLVKENILFIVLTIVVVMFSGKNLNPFSRTIFTFHDITQGARIAEFKYAFLSGQLIPKVAPHFSFNLGYPIFKFYAPSAYIISNIFSLFNLSPPDVIQISFFSSIIIGLIGAYIFLRKYFDKAESLVGSVLYITSLYVPLSIFVRGNLAESWLIALLPLGFYSLSSTNKLSMPGSISRVVVLILLFTSHNVLSLFACLYLLLFLIVTKSKKDQFVLFGLGLLGSMYFYLPFMLESSLTWAKTVALKTNLFDHFLCIRQLFGGNWGFGGSAPGCLADGMSFKIGKIHLLMFLSALILLISNLRNKNVKPRAISLMVGFFITITTLLLFATTNYSKFIWSFFEFLKPMQYPWRLIALSGIGFSVFGAYVVSAIPRNLRLVISYLLIAVVLIVSSKYFYGQKILKSQFEHDYLSTQYISTKSAYQVPEYLPKTVNYDYWRSFEPQNAPSSLPVFNQPAEITYGKYEVLKNNAFAKVIKVQPQDQITINVHYFPGWEITVNGSKFKPDSKNLDDLGRPFFPVYEDAIIQIYFKATSSEIIGAICLVLSIILASWLPFVFYGKRKRD